MSHRDILGSILGLGIERHAIGDIIVKENIAYIIVMKDISDFILTNLVKVGKANVKVAHIDLAQLDIPEPKFKEINTTVPSMRLDCLASSGLDILEIKYFPLSEKASYL